MAHSENTAFEILYSDDPSKNLETFQEALIEYRSLHGCDFSGMVFPPDSTAFKGTKFYGNVNFTGTTFENADFYKTIFESDVSFVNAVFLGNVTFWKASFMRQVDFSGTRFKGEVDLRNVKYAHGPVLRDAIFDSKHRVIGNLSGADLRGTSGMILDGALVRFARFSAKAKDPWSILRRLYTGPRLFFNLLFLIAFILPYAARTMIWHGVHRGQESAVAVTQRLAEFSRQQKAAYRQQVASDSASMIMYEHMVSLIEMLPDSVFIECARSTQSGNCKEYAVWQLLISMDKLESYDKVGGLAFVRSALPTGLAIALILYNIMRIVLTFGLAPLRDEEERSGHVPAYSVYKVYIVPHKIARILLMVSVVALAYHAILWLGQSIFLPV